MSTSRACAGLRSALADAGVGGAVSPALEAHLAGCASCRGELDARLGLSRVIDEELRAALAVEPSPDLLPRVRSAAAAGRAGRGLFALPWLGWAALGFLLALATFHASRPGGPTAPTVGARSARSLPAPAAPPVTEAGAATTPAAPRAPAAVEPAPGPGREVPPGSGVAATARAAGARAAATSTAGPRPATRGTGELPVVLLAPDEEPALALFLASLERRRAAPRTLLADGTDAPPLNELTMGSIFVEPLTITPLGRTE